MPLKYISNFWRIDFEISLIVNWSANCIITNSTGAGTLAIIETNLYVPVITLSTQDNRKLLEQLKSEFKRIINWNKYQSKASTQAQYQFLD